MTDPSASYDNVPYESYAFPQSHPGHLAAVGALFGMEPVPLDRARVLEVGCAGGGNLVPVAAAYGGSEFVGVDVSPVQIARGREAVEALGLRNVKLYCMGLEELAEGEETVSGGAFDYIIAHGVYSWVAAPVREALLVLCGRLLKPQGVAYVSYNTLPGSLARDTLRDMVRYHTAVRLRGDGGGNPGTGTGTEGGLMQVERIREARRLCAVLGEAFENREDAYARSMMEELSHVAGLHDFYLAHEHLEATNEPCYFYEFMEQAQRHGLRYLGDAEMQTMAAGDMPASVRGQLRGMAGSVEEAEQYHDFIRNRAFRQTLLCRKEVTLKRTIGAEVVRRFHFASSLRAVEVDVEAAAGGESGRDEGRLFRDAAGTVLEMTDALARAALLELKAAWPRCVSFGVLLERAAARAGMGLTEPGAAATAAASLTRALLTSYSASRGMEFHLYPPVFQAGVSAFPKAWEVARWQASRSGWVTNLRHENVSLGGVERAFLWKVDGTRCVAELEAETGGGDAGEMLKELGRLGLLVR